ncbi:MAG: pilus assembly protein CpaC, partial [Mesorhizobium sp.]
MRLIGKLPVIAAAAIGLFLIGTNAPGLVEAKAANRAAGVTASVASQRVKLGLNKSVVIDLPSDAYDILVANPAVADAVTRTARRIYLFGKAVGETNIFVFGPNGEQIASLDLAVERDVAGLEDYLKRFLPTSQIKVELLNDNVILTGNVDT